MCETIKSPHNHAVRIAHIMESVFQCDPCGLVNSDVIRKAPFWAMMTTLTYLYGKNGDESLNIIAQFCDDFYFYNKWSIDELLNFDSNSKMTSEGSIDIGYSNGEEAMRAIIAAFSKVCQELK